MIITNQQVLEEIKKDNCKSKAKDLIANCDWSVLPDVKLQNKIDFEIKNNSPEAYPSIINTRYNFISAPFNLIFGTLISTRKIYVYCPY